MRALLPGRSAVVIAHCRPTVGRGDKILAMHRGELLEQGTHEELLAHGGIHARLHALQFSDDPTATAPRAPHEAVAPSAQDA